MTLFDQAGLGLTAALALMTVVWGVSLVLRDVSIIDWVWGLVFVLMAWLYRTTGFADPGRAWLVPFLVTLWGLRLAIHLVWRHRGEDPRYAEMRSRSGPGFRWRSLVTVFWLQAGIAWVVAWPLLLSIRRGGELGTLDLVGMTLFALGLALESAADAQLVRFRHDPSNRNRVLDRGLWRYSRHPNYFGEALVWWGLWLLAVAVGAWWTVFSPLLMTWLLVRVSGVPMLEERLVETRPGYARYIRRTPAFVPWFPRDEELEP